MAIYAIIRDTIVENVIVWDGVSEYPIPDGTRIVYIREQELPAIYRVSPGWQIINGSFSPPVDNE